MCHKRVFFLLFFLSSISIMYSGSPVVPAPYTKKDAWDAVGRNDIYELTKIARTQPVLLTESLAILNAGNKLEIAKYLYNEHRAQNKPLSAKNLELLRYNAVGSQSPKVVEWVDDIIREIPEFDTPQNVVKAILNNDFLWLISIGRRNPLLLVTPYEGVLPIMYTAGSSGDGKKVEKFYNLDMARYLYDEHNAQQKPLTNQDLLALLVKAYSVKDGFAVARWLLYTVKVDPRPQLTKLFELSALKPENKDWDSRLGYMLRQLGYSF